MDNPSKTVTQIANETIHQSNNFLFSIMSITYPACNDNPIEGSTSAKPIRPMKKMLSVISYNHQPIKVVSIRSPTTNRSLPVMKSLNSENWKTDSFLLFIKIYKYVGRNYKNIVKKQSVLVFNWFKNKQFNNYYDKTCFFINLFVDKLVLQLFKINYSAFVNLD